MTICWFDQQEMSVSVGSDPGRRGRVFLMIQHGEDHTDFIKLNLPKDLARQIGQEMITKSGKSRTRKSRVQRIDQVITRAEEVISKMESHVSRKMGSK